MNNTSCDTCLYNEYDEEWQCDVCTMHLDEDEVAHLMQDNHYQCPYYKFGDEYLIVRKQM